jgi:formamidopyrimidine-DNA glycosylase
MPELPEVETVVRDLRAHGLEGTVVCGVDVRWPRTVGGNPAAFRRRLVGRHDHGPRAPAKHIVLALDSGDRLLIHLRMTGKFRFATRRNAPAPHDRVVLSFGDGRRLAFNDTRKFGRFPSSRPTIPTRSPNSPAPSRWRRIFTTACLRARLKGKRRMLKPLLLDQRIVAGLGNIYVDEALWRARLHPERRADTLNDDDIRRLHAAIRAVLKQAVNNGGTTLGDGKVNFYSVSGHRGRNADGLRVFRRDGPPLPALRHRARAHRGRPARHPLLPPVSTEGERVQPLTPPPSRLRSQHVLSRGANTSQIETAALVQSNVDAGQSPRQRREAERRRRSPRQRGKKHGHRQTDQHERAADQDRQHQTPGCATNAPACRSKLRKAPKTQKTGETAMLKNTSFPAPTASDATDTPHGTATAHATATIPGKAHAPRTTAAFSVRRTNSDRHNGYSATRATCTP